MHISIVIPVVNEADRINQTIREIKRQDTKLVYQIIVVDGSADHSTIEVIDDENVIKAISEKGRGNQMNEGACVSEGEVLLFLHADTRLPDNALNMIYETLKDFKYAAGAFDLLIDSGNPLLYLISAAASIRSRITRIPFGDQAIFIRKEFFEEIDGYKNIPLMEDIELMRRIKKMKKKIRILNSKVKTSARMWLKNGIIISTVKNIWIQILFKCGVSPEKLARIYYK